MLKLHIPNYDSIPYIEWLIRKYESVTKLITQPTHTFTVLLLLTFNTNSKINESFDKTALHTQIIALIKLSLNQ